MSAFDSAGNITPAAARAAHNGGHVGWLRYHYNISGEEIATAHAAGLWVSLIAEFDTATWHPPIHAPELGEAHARIAVGVARNLGFPPGSVIWLTADAMIYPAQFLAAGRYWALAGPTIRDAGFQVGAYGGSLFVDHLVDQGLADRAWECGADSWNSANGDPRHAVRSKRAVIRQRGGGNVGGVGVDFNDVVDAGAWGQWFPAGSEPASIPAVPATQPQEADMAPPLYRFTDGTEFVLVATDDKIATGGFGWHAFEGPDEVRRAVAAGVVRETGIVQLQVTGSEVADALFESYPILNTSLRRPAAGG